MFEKSKSSITFKEFENKLNIITEFESDWGHFYDTDYEDECNTNINLNPIFHHKIHKPKKRIYKKRLIDIENQELEKENTKQKIKENAKQSEKEKQPDDYNYEKENKIVDVIRKVLVCVQMTCITIAMGYVILKIV